MKSFKQRFNTLLQEESPYGNPEYDSVADAEEFDIGMDADQDSDEYLTKGLKETIEAVQSSFDGKMQTFADQLAPEAVKSMTIGELKDTVGKVFKYVKGISVYSGAKMDAMASSPQAILAGFIATDPAKQSAFDDLNKKLETFNTKIEETEVEISTLKANIDEFVDDIVSPDVDDRELAQLGQEARDGQGAREEFDMGEDEFNMEDEY